MCVYCMFNMVPSFQQLGHVEMCLTYFLLLCFFITIRLALKLKFWLCLQVLSLGYYSISYFPGGSAGMKFLTSAFTSSIMKCFGQWPNFLLIVELSSDLCPYSSWLVNLSPKIYQLKLQSDLRILLRWSISNSFLGFTVCCYLPHLNEKNCFASCL